MRRSFAWLGSVKSKGKLKKKSSVNSGVISSRQQSQGAAITGATTSIKGGDPSIKTSLSTSSVFSSGNATVVDVRRRFNNAIIPPVVPKDARPVGVIFWPTDMRVHDHYPLKLAQLQAKKLGVPVVAFVCLDTRTFAQPSRILGCYRQGPQRARFALECVEALRGELRAVGVPLLVRFGFPEEVLPQLFRELGVSECFTSTQYAPHEKKVHDKLLDLESSSIVASDMRTKVHSVWHSTLIHMDDLHTPVRAMKNGFRWFHDDALVANIRPTQPFDALDGLRALPSLLHYFDTFEVDRRPAGGGSGTGELATLYNETGNEIIGLGDIPTLQDLGYPCMSISGERLTPNVVVATATSHPGGESNALLHVDRWLESGGMKSMIGLARKKRPTMKMYSQELLRISPYVSTGCVSPRKLYERVREYCHENSLDGSSHIQFQELFLRLCRRDYWHFTGLVHGQTMFYSYGPTPEFTDEIPDWRFDEKILRKWCHGMTGFPFADASMRELVTTGWVGDAGRQALIWLVSRGLGQDWRAGAEWFERCSLDYDPFVCYGNCAYFSELTPDDFGDHVNTLQFLALKHDQTGIYVKKWLPQLSKVPPVYVHRPHVMTEKMQDMHGVFLGKTYPYPIKLWDGAQNSIGQSQLGAAFSTPDQQASFGAFEALTFSRDTILPPAERHLVAGASSYAKVEGKLASMEAAEYSEEDDGLLRLPVSAKSRRGVAQQQVHQHRQVSL